MSRALHVLLDMYCMTHVCLSACSGAAIANTLDKGPSSVHTQRYECIRVCLYPNSASSTERIRIRHALRIRIHVERG